MPLGRRVLVGGRCGTELGQLQAGFNQMVSGLRDREKLRDLFEGAVAAAVERFGGIDVVVNNASAIDLSGTRELSMKKYDLMQDINARGTFLLSKTALPHLERSSGAHVLTLSPEIGAATGIEFLRDGRLLAAAEPVRRGGGSAAVVTPSG